MLNGVIDLMRFTQIYNNNQNVLESAKRRIEFVFDNFENIHVSVSGGKDSTVLAYLTLQEAKKRNRQVGIFFLDEEVVYQSTIDMIEYIVEEISPKNVYPLWLQIEFNLTNSTSTTERHLVAWEAGKHKIWMRPKKDYAIKFPPWDISKQKSENKEIGLGFYAVVENFENCYNDTAFLVGLRATESPNRWRTVSKNPANINGTDIFWATRKGKNFSMYPLYDWNFHDIWKFVFDNNLRYSKIYDFQLKKGMGINEMRISSLIHERSFKSLVELPEFEPKTYDKLLKRIKGISFAQETGKAAKMFRTRKLPKNFKSWIEYRDFLLNTHRDKSKIKIFKKRFSKQLNNEYVARQQCRQLILNDTENNVPIDNKPDPRQKLIDYYMEVL